MTTDEKLARIADHLAAKKAEGDKAKADLKGQREKPRPANVKDLADRVAALEDIVFRLTP